MESEATSIAAASAAPAKTTLHIVRKADLVAGRTFDWEDPDHLAELNPDKRRALLENPLSRSDQDPVQIIGTFGGRVIGRLDLVAGEVVAADGTRVPMLWASALFVHQQFRASLMGVSLILKMQALHHTVGTCGVSQMALPVFEKLKWRDMPMRRFMALRRSRSVVQRYLGDGLRGRMATWLADLALMGHRALLAIGRRVRTARLRCQPLRLDDAAADAALDALFNGTPATNRFHRSAAWVKWVLTQRFGEERHAGREYRAAFSILDRDGNTVAYFLIRSSFYPTATHRGYKNLTLGSLLDWEIFRPASISLSQVILLAMREVARLNVDAIEVCLPDHGGLPNLARWGMARVGHLHLLVRASPASPLSKPHFASAAAWKVRPAEGDNAIG